MYIGCISICVSILVYVMSYIYIIMYCTCTNMFTCTSVSVSTELSVRLLSVCCTRLAVRLNFHRIVPVNNTCL